MAYMAAVTMSAGNRSLAGEEYHLYDEEESGSRRGSRSSHGSNSPGSARRNHASGPSPLGNADDFNDMLASRADASNPHRNLSLTDGQNKHHTEGQANLQSREKTPDNMIRMVLCGREFQVLASTLKHSGSAILQKLAPTEDCEFFMPDMSSRLGQQCYYFGSRPSAFEAIIMFLESSPRKLHAPTDMSLDAWLDELLFYQIKGIDDAIGQRRSEDTDATEDGNKKDVQVKRIKTREEMSTWEKYKAIMWAVTDGETDNPIDPDSPGKDDEEEGPTFTAPPYTSEIWTYFSMTILLSSVVLLCVETLPQYREKTEQQCSFANSTLYPECAAWWNDQSNVAKNPNFTDLASTNCTCTYAIVEYTDSNIYITEAVFVIWFTIELVLRFIVCPNKVAFVKGVLNIIDVLAILPFYIALGAPDATGGLDSIRILRLFRVFRIFKLSRHSAGLQIFAMALYRSRSILGQLFVFVMTVSILFSAMIFYCEYKNVDSDYGYFSSIPQSLWWAIVTMTTLGYGDMVPQTAIGQVIGSACALSGILVVSLPIPVFVENFQRLWNAQYLKKKHGKHKKESAERQLNLRKTSAAVGDHFITNDDTTATLVTAMLSEGIDETRPERASSSPSAASVASGIVVRVESEATPVANPEGVVLGSMKADQVSSV